MQLSAPGTRLRSSSSGAPLRVADLACGWGDNGLWLASQGHDVTLIDVSRVALDAAAERAEALGVEVDTVVADLAAEAPPGPWDLAIVAHYLERPLLGSIHRSVAVGGRLACVIATETTLERHERPGRRFVLDRGELPSLIGSPWEIERFDEDWRPNDAHEAWLVARRIA